jgi:hypothetical protein
LENPSGFISYRVSKHGTPSGLAGASAARVNPYAKRPHPTPGIDNARRYTSTGLPHTASPHFQTRHYRDLSHRATGVRYTKHPALTGVSYTEFVPNSLETLKNGIANCTKPCSKTENNTADALLGTAQGGGR